MATPSVLSLRRDRPGRSLHFCPLFSALLSSASQLVAGPELRASLWTLLGVQPTVSGQLVSPVVLANAKMSHVDRCSETGLFPGMGPDVSGAP